MYKHDLFEDLEDVSVTNVLEYAPIVLLHKIAAMIGLREAIEKRCKENEVIPKIIEAINAYKAFKPLSKRKMAEDYPHTAFPMILDLPQERFYTQAMCRAIRRDKMRTPNLWIQSYGCEKEADNYFSRRYRRREHSGSPPDC